MSCFYGMEHLSSAIMLLAAWEERISGMEQCLDRDTASEGNEFDEFFSIERNPNVLKNAYGYKGNGYSRTGVASDAKLDDRATSGEKAEVNPADSSVLAAFSLRLEDGRFNIASQVSRSVAGNGDSVEDNVGFENVDDSEAGCEIVGDSVEDNSGCDVRERVLPSFVLTTFNDHGLRRNRAITSDDVGGVGSILCGFDDAAGKRRVKRQDRIATLKRRHCYSVYKLALTRGFVLPCAVPATPDYRDPMISKRQWDILLRQWERAVQHVADSWEYSRVEVTERY